MQRDNRQPYNRVYVVEKWKCSVDAKNRDGFTHFLT